MVRQLYAVPDLSVIFDQWWTLPRSSMLVARMEKGEMYLRLRMLPMMMMGRRRR